MAIALGFCVRFATSNASYAGLRHAAVGARGKGQRMRNLPKAPCDPRRRSDRRGVLRVVGIGCLDRAFRPVQREHADAHVDQLGQRRDKPQREAGIPVGHRALERGPQVLVVRRGERRACRRSQPVDPHLFVRTVHARRAALGKLGEVPRMSRRVLDLKTVLAQPIAPISTKRFQHGVSFLSPYV
jgi:hypothetical protein